MSAFTRCEAICRCRCSSPMAMTASTPRVGGSGTQPARYFEHAADWSHAASHVINLGEVIDKAAVCPQRGFQLARLNANPPSNSHTTRRKWLNLACFEQSVVECRRRCRRTESRRPTVPTATPFAAGTRRWAPTRRDATATPTACCTPSCPPPSLTNSYRPTHARSPAP